jgi:YhcH/YjgK/YiaL family protein
MIIDTLDQGPRYTSLHPRFAAAFEYLRQLPAGQPAGRYDIDGDECFALVQSYTTKPLAEVKFEAHRKYMDIQFVLAGRETMLWSPLRSLPGVTQPYVEERDVILFAMPERPVPVHVRAGEFTVFFPEDGHAPCLQLDGPEEIRKVVIKVRV